MRVDYQARASLTANPSPLGAWVQVIIGDYCRCGQGKPFSRHAAEHVAEEMQSAVPFNATLTPVEIGLLSELFPPPPLPPRPRWQRQMTLPPKSKRPPRPDDVVDDHDLFGLPPLDEQPNEKEPNQ